MDQNEEDEACAKIREYLDMEDVDTTPMPAKHSKPVTDVAKIVAQMRKKDPNFRVVPLETQIGLYFSSSRVLRVQGPAPEGLVFFGPACKCRRRMCRC